MIQETKKNCFIELPLFLLGKKEQIGDFVNGRLDARNFEDLALKKALLRVLKPYVRGFLGFTLRITQTLLLREDIKISLTSPSHKIAASHHLFDTPVSGEKLVS